MEEEHRSDSLETRIGHLEERVQQLTDLLNRQQQQIDTLITVSNKTTEQLTAFRKRMTPEGLL
jgi:uncharacterized coiled-coil protein SlyX